MNVFISNYALLFLKLINKIDNKAMYYFLNNQKEKVSLIK